MNFRFANLRHLALSRRALPFLSAIALILSLLWSSVGYAANPADVQIDGESLFQVTQTTSQSAEARAEAISQRLQSVVESDDAIKVEVRQQGGQSLIWLNNRQLLKLFPSDITPQRSPVKQAEEWSQTLTSALTNARDQRTQSYLRNAIILSAVLLLLAGGLNWLMGKVWSYPARWLLKQIGTIETLEQPLTPQIQQFLKITLALARLGLLVETTLTVTSLFPLTRSWSALIRSGLWNGLTNPFLTLGEQSYSFQDMLLLLGMLLILMLAIGSFVNFLKGRVLPGMGISRGAIEIVAVVTRYTLITLGVIVLLQIWGLNLSSLTIVGSALGVGIGLGLQGIAKNFISGMVLLFERSVQVGDLIQVGEYIGTVERVSARNLIVSTLDRISIIVPSSMFLEDIVVNWSHRNSTCRLHVPVGVAYGTELDKVKKLLLKAADDHDDVLRTPQPEVVFVGFGESSLDFELLVWVNR
ncbi:MAG: mechanosensitive ion channel domain-containing protein, partial [Cyanobacteria bacterium P01_F01_bin.42]